MAHRRVRGGKKGRQSAHNKLTGKYIRQRERTEANKRHRAERNERRSKEGGGEDC